MKQYKQCRLERELTDATVATTGWIEERGAIEGAVVEVLKPSAIAGDWTVVEVYDHALGEDLLKEHQRLNRKSLPSVESIA